MPIEILTVERKQLYEQRSGILGEQEELKKIMRQDSLQLWQEKLDVSEKRRLTHRPIPQVDNWVNRKRGKVNYYLTQMLFNHGCFRAYLYRFKYDESPEVPAGCRMLRGCRTRILLVPALCRREKETGEATRIITYPRDRRENDAEDGGKLNCA